MQPHSMRAYFEQLQSQGLAEQRILTEPDGRQRELWRVQQGDRVNVVELTEQGVSRVPLELWQ